MVSVVPQLDVLMTNDAGPHSVSVANPEALLTQGLANEMSFNAAIAGQAFNSQDACEHSVG
eukprot:12050959-Karenia_brevis.AAC.1